MGWFLSDAPPRVASTPPVLNVSRFIQAIASARDVGANAILIPGTKQVKRNPGITALQ